jgi:hypothetical protein
MAATNEPKPTGFTVSFATVEKALLRMHAVEPRHEEAWRSRINFLRREGLLGERPGSGRRIGYHTAAHLPRLVLALEMAQAAIAPQAILSLVRGNWDDQLEKIFKEAEKARAKNTSDVWLLLAGITAMVERDGAIPVIAATTEDRLDVLRMALDDSSVPSRALVVNFTARLRRFHKALSDIYPQPEDHALDRRREKSEGEMKSRGQGRTKARVRSRTRRRQR